ncbi:hypothetical protein P152DRAFT_20274 [Eremomyces bilateralis CBS 781.70]|uniref:Uncharacterized protein n=1 Tax=Eremomyces bilateralis CBS 781.70 TaxID=1392243 RepID=A0A6G1GHM1_9PEZI|nr:uncharacterized protein P152DRAFT_20274 [Eremomyces bilateralis CBS 781.70]KAF1817482.1 hypothetical protein P152DRAFT_20274 [Eremomyces bilateralis CBS 781.70]
MLAALFVAMAVLTCLLLAPFRLLTCSRCNNRGPVHNTQRFIPASDMEQDMELDDRNAGHATCIDRFLDEMQMSTYIDIERDMELREMGFL